MRKNKGFTKKTNKPATIPKQQTKPVPKQNSSNGSFMSNAGSAVGTGIGFGVGSSIGHAAFDRIFSNSSSDDNNNTLTNSNSNCEKILNEFNQCMNNSKEFGTDIGNCHKYIDMIQALNCGKEGVTK